MKKRKRISQLDKFFRLKERERLSLDSFHFQTFSLQIKERERETERSKRENPL